VEIKVYTIKLNPPRWLRNVITFGVLPIGALVGAVAVVRAAVTLTTFSAGTPIKAADVNANFAALSTALVSVPTVTGWTAFSPVLMHHDGSTPAAATFNTSGVWRRVGDSIEVNIYTVLHAVDPSPSYYVWQLPTVNATALTFDDTKMPASAQTPVLGNAEVWAAGTGASVCTADKVGTTGIALDCDGNNNSVSGQYPFMYAANSSMSIHFIAPISGWAVQ
jgi:hypothetical protein